MWETSGALDEHKVLKLWTDYHLARASAPKLPTTIWKKKEEKLNAAWKKYFTDKFSKPRPA